MSWLLYWAYHDALINLVQMFELRVFSERFFVGSVILLARYSCDFDDFLKSTINKTHV